MQRVIRTHADKDLRALRNIKEVVDWRNFGIVFEHLRGFFAIDIPIFFKLVLDLGADFGHLFEVVGRRRDDDPEHEIAIAAGQIFNLGNKSQVKKNVAATKLADVTNMTKRLCNSALSSVTTSVTKALPKRSTNDVIGENTAAKRDCSPDLWARLVRKIHAVAAGTKSNATKSDMTSAAAAARAISRNNCPACPVRKALG